MLRTLFTKHPQSIGETYAEHCQFASLCGFKLMWAGFACVIHSIFPFLFANTASDTVKQITQKMAERKSKKNLY